MNILINGKTMAAGNYYRITRTNGDTSVFFVKGCFTNGPDNLSLRVKHEHGWMGFVSEKDIQNFIKVEVVKVNNKWSYQPILKVA